MVIQRIQTLYLFVAAVLMAVFCFLPYATGAEPNYLSYNVADTHTLLVLGILDAVLLAIDIFLYKTLKLQIRVATICAVLVALTALMSIVITARIDGASLNIWGGIVVPAIALASTWMALRGMNHDRRLLSSADRLR